MNRRLLGETPAIVRLRTQIERLAPTPLPILVRGETGTGKEVVARLLHRRSGRRGPFVPVDCGALPSTLVEAELFGYEQGAFTGADARREGLVAIAEGGTFFLDEIGELPLDAQSRLLRLLEDGSYRPVGGAAMRRADIRVVAATWRDLDALVAQGRFRRDLYHRLAAVELHLPPLRERPDDVELLFRHFLAEASPHIEPTPALLQHLRRWHWPGNVRELRNVARYVAALAHGPRAEPRDLPPRVRDEPPDPTRLEVRLDLPYPEARRVVLEAFQRRYVEAQLARHGGNVSATARACGMDRRSIQRILARHRDT